MIIFSEHTNGITITVEHTLSDGVVIVTMTGDGTGKKTYFNDKDHCKDALAFAKHGDWRKSFGI